jgi:predicted  nucleic acid-binding Zn-ribbon protein
MRALQELIAKMNRDIADLQIEIAKLKIEIRKLKNPTKVFPL